MEAAADGAFAELAGVGDLLIAQPADLAEQEDLSVAWAQGGQGFVEPETEVGVGGLRGFLPQLIQAVRPGAPLLAPSVVGEDVPADAVEPGPLEALLRVAPESAGNANEDFLAEVFSEGVIRRHPPQEAEDLQVVAPEEARGVGQVLAHGKREPRWEAILSR